MWHSVNLDYILKELRRLQDEGLTLVDVRDALAELVGSAPNTAKNADRLGGFPAVDYLTVSRGVSLFLTRASAIETYLTKTETAADSDKLGGVGASEYATKTYVSDTIAGLDITGKPPVGSVLAMWNDTDPATVYANTSWELVAEGLSLIQSGNTYTLGSTGGEASHTLTIAEMPNHRHFARVVKGAGTGTDWVQPPTAGAGGTLEETNATTYVGDGGAHNNMPPYLAVNWWKRIA